MAVEIKKQADDFIHVVVSGRLTREDYEHFVPEIEAVIAERGKVRILFDMLGFHGWNAGALWEDTKFAYRHFRDIELLAVVGETRWQKGMVTFCKPFTKAEVRYFDHEHMDEAQEWLQQEHKPAPA
jgi:hypothetical protein